ncbi:MAG: S-layer homology domain-containing protein [Firmicutes bacterium]|nr:S-layer homology domain-containing protein [Bacillota bacterium]
MKKRVLSAALSLCMLLTLLPTAALATGDETTDPGTSPASKTLQEEINTAENGATVSLTKDETGSITISTGKTITLDLAGHKLTNTADNHTVTVETGATLTVTDSSAEKTGTIDNTSHQKGAVVNHGTFVLENGNLTRSAEASAAPASEGADPTSGNNSWYVVWNTGDMTVNGGKIFFSESNQGFFSSLIDNGWKDPDNNTSKAFATLTITGGTLSGGKITVKNDDYGILDVKGGTITQSYTSYTSIYNWNEATVSGGSINGAVVSAGDGKTGEDAYEHGKLEISGNATFSDRIIGAANSTIEISGGTFKVQPNAAFLKPGLSATEKDGTFSITPAETGTVYPARLADQSETPITDLYDKDSYNVNATQATEAETGDYYTEVAVSVKNLKKHTNANSNEGHWVGFALAAPDGAKQMKYAVAASKDALILSDPADLEQNVVTVGEENKSGIAFYVDAGSKTLKTWAQVQWLGENGAVLSNTVYHMDLSGVTLAMDKDTMPKIRPAKLHDNAETNAYKDEDLYTAGSYDAKITSQGAGGVYNVAISVKQLREHTNAKKDKRYWVGFDLEAPEGVTKFKYAFDATISETAKEENVETLPENKTGVAFYFNDKTAKTVTVQWVAEGEGDNTPIYKPITFSVDLSGVAYYQAPSHGGSGSSGGSASTTYTLTFETNGGSAISKVTKNKGTSIDLAQYAPTKSGATFEGWYADKGLTKKITSVKLDANTTVYAKWTEAPVSGLPFGDVKSADWFYNDVKYVYEKGMMAGTAADVFAPNATTTRAMIVTILYRLEGSPAVTGTSAFVDVPAGQWYTDAVNWAAANQIVKGTSATTFAPNDSITREQMTAILYRYAQYKGYDMTKKADLSGYSDNSQVSAYAKDALAWANAAKLINGVTNTTLAPQGNATRAQVSAILHRFCDGVAK